MNDFDIDRALRTWRGHPVLYPAARTVAALRNVANANSDGWAYWPKPARSAARLMELIERDGTSRYSHGSREDATERELRAALAPVKAFRTRSGLEFPVFASMAEVEAYDRAEDERVARLVRERTVAAFWSLPAETRADLARQTLGDTEGVPA